VEAEGHDPRWIPQIMVDAGRSTPFDIRLERLRSMITGS
jgi:hypothetical protein